MKKFYYLSICTILAVVSSCGKEEMPANGNVETPGQIVTFEATVKDESTKSSFDINGNKALFRWSEGDRIAVQSNTGRIAEFKLNEGEAGKASGKFSGELLQGETIGSHAFYPYSTLHTDKYFNLPSEYGDQDSEYIESTNAALTAEIADGAEGAEFKHIAGVIAVRFTSVPAGVNQLVFSVRGNFITGNFDFTEGQISSGGDGTSVTFNFKQIETAGPMTFYIPVPTGKYSGLSYELKNTVTHQVFSGISEKERTIERAQLIALNVGEVKEGLKVEIIDGKETYVISNEAELIMAGKLASMNRNINIKLEDNITLTAPAEGGSNWEPIGRMKSDHYPGIEAIDGPYLGTFDGNGKTISGIVINTDSYGQAMFSGIGEGAVIKNLTLSDCTIKAEKDIVSSIAAWNFGTIENCSILGTPDKGVEIWSGFDKTTLGKPSANACVGGLVAANMETGLISGCTVSGKVMLSVDQDMLGGIAGYNLGEITGCSVICSDSDIAIEGGYYIGGLIGINSGNIHNCKVENSGEKNMSIIGSSYIIGGFAGMSAKSKTNTTMFTDCSVIANGTGAIIIKGLSTHNGGFVGQAEYTKIANCKVKGITITDCIGATGGLAGVTSYTTCIGCSVYNTNVSCISSNSYDGNAGGLIGKNVNTCTAIGCFVDNVVVSGDTNTGGLAGINSASIISCYAYHPATIADATAIAIEGAKNVAGSNTGTVTDSYYAAYNSGDIFDYSGVQTSWDDAVSAMNAAINSSTSEPKYLWSGEYSEPVLTLSE